MQIHIVSVKNEDNKVIIIFMDEDTDEEKIVSDVKKRQIPNSESVFL